MKKINSKLGVSVMIGYILLITLGIVMGVIIYQWMKTYIPKEPVECPDGASIYLKDYSCSSTNLEITIQNNGRFSLGGYFIKAANFSDQEVPTIDLSSKILDGGGSSGVLGAKSDSGVAVPVLFLGGGGNPVKTGKSNKKY